MSYNGTVRCGYCGDKGHNRRGCPTLKKYAEENPDSYAAQVRQLAKKRASNRKCGWCCGTGHNTRTCSEKLGTAVKLKELAPHVAKLQNHILSSLGFGKGAIVKQERYDDTIAYGTVLSASYKLHDTWHTPLDGELVPEEEPRLNVLWHNGDREDIWTPSPNRELLATLDARIARGCRHWGYSSYQLVAESKEPIPVKVSLHPHKGQLTHSIEQWIKVIDESMKKCEDSKKVVENA